MQPLNSEELHCRLYSSSLINPYTCISCNYKFNTVYFAERYTDHCILPSIMHPLLSGSTLFPLPKSSVMYPLKSDDPLRRLQSFVFHCILQTELSTDFLPLILHLKVLNCILQTLLLYKVSFIYEHCSIFVVQWIYTESFKICYSTNHLSFMSSAVYLLFSRSTLYPLNSVT